MSIYKRPNSAVWWCKFYVNGRAIRKSTGETDRELAERCERRLRVEAETSAPAKRRGVGTLDDLCRADVDRAKVEATNPAWIKRVEGMWSELILELGSIDPINVTSAAVFAYVAERKKTCRNQTIRRELQCLKRGLEDAKARKWITELPTPWPSLEKDPPNEKLRGKLHTAEVLTRIVTELPPVAVDGVRFAVMTGLRCAELHRVRASWLAPAPPKSEAAAVLKIPVGFAKNKKKGRDLGLNKEAVEIIRRRAGTFGDQVFPSYCYTQALKRTAARLSYCGLCYGVTLLKRRRCEHCDELATVPRIPLKSVTLRDLRHTFASNALKKSGGNLSAVAGAMGHSELEITTLYLHAEEADVLNLAGSVLTLKPGTPGTTDTQNQAQKKPGRKARAQTPVIDTEMARDTGVEPVTYGFGGAQYSIFPSVSEAVTSEKVQAFLNEGKPFGHSPGHSVIEPDHGRVNVHCNKCSRVLEVENGPNLFECLMCGSKDVVVEL
jgi:integrase